MTKAVKDKPPSRQQLALLATAELTRAQLSWLTRAQLSGLTGDQLSWLTGDQLSGLTRAQLSWLTRAQLSGLTRAQLSGLTGDQLSWLTRDQLSGLTGDQLSGLTGDQLSWLTRDQLSGLTGDQLSGLTGDQLSWLTRAQLSGLTRAQAVPVVPKLYSTMLSAIEDEKRILNQATFGPETEIEPEKVCTTPMCIAGHTVNLAGKPGYDLMEVFGFAGAATLIHRASRPDAPPPRYDAYPNDWALAYIEVRAAEEKSA